MQPDTYYARNREQVLTRIREKRRNASAAERERVRARNRDGCRRYRSRARQDARLWARKKIRELRHRAAKEGLPFDLTVDDIVVPERCPVLGIPVSISVGTPAAQRASVDRIIGPRGYVKGNVAVISYRANSVKSDLSPAQIRDMLRYVESAELLA